MKTYPKIPTNPITLTINGFIIDNILKQFGKYHLSDYDIFVTSGYRGRERNKKAGGAEFSAHLYNLARDFTLKKKTDGNFISPGKLRELYDTVVVPNWDGFTSFNPPNKGVTGSIHVNISRDITLKTSIVEKSIGAVFLGVALKSLIKRYI